MSKLILIGAATSPYVQRVVIALNEKHVHFDRLDLDPAAAPDWFRAISPLGRAPVLRIERDGQPPAVIFETAAILDYLEEAVPCEKLYPADSLARAQQRAWIAFSAHLLADLDRFSAARDGATRAALVQKLKRLEAVVGGGPYFAGQRFSLVDAAFAPAFRQIAALDSAACTGLLDGLLGLEHWSRSLATRPSVRAATPDDYVTRHLAQLRAAPGGTREAA